IAGLVRGASKGEGLGNQFLANIREVDAIVHVVRSIENDDEHHVEGSVDPVRDIETVETELLLADLDSLEKRADGLAKRAKGGDKEAKALMPVIEPVLVLLREGRPARHAKVTDEQKPLLKLLQLITAKPVLYVCNVDEGAAATGNRFSEKVAVYAKSHEAEAVVISAAIEAEIAVMGTAEEKAEFLSTLGLEEPGLNRVIRAGYRLLGLITYFTVGPKETRAWTIGTHTKAPQAAGAIHTDFERGFICAETIAYDDYVKYGGEQGAKDAGKMRQEGKEYVVQDGDVLLFRFNV
ncbi:MAG: redox-regulated ATPase YchF, partial [Alphaproteobacteria bacterium]